MRRLQDGRAWLRLAWWCLVLAVVGLGLVWWLAREPAAPPPSRSKHVSEVPAARRRLPPRPYEEPRTLAAEQARQRVVEAVFAALRRTGVRPRDITFSPAQNGGRPGRITAHLPAGLSPGRVARSLGRRLAAVGARWRWDQGEKSLLVSLGGRPIQRVILLPPPRRKLPPATPPPRHRLALIIDDMGHGLEPARRLLALKLPVTLSILPYSSHAARVVRLARRAGRQYMVHLPMEPKGYPQVDPGPGVLLVNMPPAELRRRTREALARVPGAAGANNHMGSRFTESCAALRPVLMVLKRRGLFFVDSRTTAHSCALSLALRLGLLAGARSLFLDHDPSPAAVRRQLRRLMDMARRQDGIIAIGHPHPGTLTALEEFAPRLKRRFRVVPVSDLLRAGPPRPPGP